MEQATIIAVLILAGCALRWIGGRLRQRANQRLWLAFMRLDRGDL